MEKLLFKLFFISTLIKFHFCFFSKPFTAEADILFVLKSGNSENKSFSFENKEEVASTAFDRTKPIFFQVHGYLENQKVQHQIELSE